MKNILFLFFLSISISISGQCPEIVLMESFENYSSCNFFQDDCTGDWCASHGKAGLEHSGVCDGMWSAEIPIRYSCPPGPGPFEPDDLVPLGAGILYNFDTPLEPGNYQISFCYCGKVGTDQDNPNSYEMRLEIVLANNYECTDNNSSYEEFPFTPGGNEPIIFTEDFNPYVYGECHDGEFIQKDNIPFSTSESFNQLWVRGNLQHAGCNSNANICIDNIILESMEGDFSCLERTDPTACADEEDYGYIHLECVGDGLEYEWSFPDDSDAFVVSCENSLSVLNAGEGLYSVTITDENDCIEIKEFEIEQVCCDDILCGVDAPINLDCDNTLGAVLLSWDPISGADHYEIQIDINDPTSCGCPISPNGNISILDETGIPQYLYETDISNACFAWRVRAVCANGIESPDSEIMCFGHFKCEPAEGFGGGGHERGLENNNSITPQVYPNPSSEVLNFELNAPGNLILTVEIYNLNGKLIKSFAEETYPNGFYKKNWVIDEHLTDGLYYVFFKTNFGTYQKNIVISKIDDKGK